MDQQQASALSVVVGANYGITELDRRKRGIFYTPSEVTDVLCAWAIRSGSETIFEPSFGGCGFLAASLRRLSNLDSSDPETRLFGCDIDRNAFTYLASTVRIDSTKRFIEGDFLALRPHDFIEKEFDIVIGNPPYISHHNMTEEQRTNALFALTHRGLTLDRKSSLWAYFVIHSLSFLKRGGRVAWILPSSFLYADYSSQVKSILQAGFSRTLVVPIEERLFLMEGTEEKTVILLGEGWQCCNEQGSFEIKSAKDLGELRSNLDGWRNNDFEGVNYKYEQRPQILLMEDEPASVYSEITSTSNSVPLGRFADIKIGIVTGANRFFVINSSTAETRGLSCEHLTFILAKFRDAPGIRLLAEDFEEMKQADKRCLLVDTSLKENPEGALRQYLNSFPEDKLNKNRTFKKRRLWHQPNDRSVPDAFFPYMQAEGPFLLLNSTQAVSTNTIHRVYFRGDTSEVLQKKVAISLLSTYSQFSAEIEGRSYGSGVLKHEPSEAARISLIVPKKLPDEEVIQTFEEVDTLLRKNERKSAQDLADELTLSDYDNKRKRRYLRILTEALGAARVKRQRKSKGL